MALYFCSEPGFSHYAHNVIAERTMYVATVILFLIPWSILLIAWRGSLKSRDELTKQDWRSYCLRAALIIATFGTLTAMGFFLSWTHNGGSPHGLMPQGGLWLSLRPIAKWSVIATVIVGAFGKGKGRLLVVGSAVSIVFVIYVLAMLEMD